MLTFYRKEPFTLSAGYSNAKDIPYPSTDIGNFKITNIVAQANGESSKVKVKVRVDSHGVFKVISASMYEKIEGEEEEAKENMEVDDKDKKEGNVDKSEVNGEQQQNDTEMDQSAASENGADQSSSSESQSKPEEQAGNGDSQENAEKKEKEKKTPTKKKTVKTIDLPVESMVHQLSKTELNNLIEKENQMVMQDRLEKERADAKNAVEEYVYEMRDKMYSTYENFVTEDDRSSFSLKLEDTENWLYEDGEDEKKQVYIDKLAELKQIGQPMADRYREAQEWPAARDDMGQTIIQIRKFVDQWTAGVSFF